MLKNNKFIRGGLIFARVVENNVESRTYNSKEPVKSAENKKRIEMAAICAGLTLYDASKYL